ncbi:MAG: adenosylcobinamide-GDP ribazoletransferase [Nitrospira sp.]|nr:adenosylcobinamide-GDP ribazoletransferase [Nitrospira sp.]MDH4368741.1 adenosylcobinamide-GDP ribazoletransferase [Nitrospira sp.]MDH5346454.1 adenosylcobinamide-GDP ribazoletransferase [Nitrospira sp.]MDH5725364.1 adenosylcobinamide-GDP ribazoletransferase [Nitrospira sp.]
MGTVARPFIFAWHFLTTIPLSRTHHEPTAPELAASMAWYSTVGLMLGGIFALSDMLLTHVFAQEVVNILVIVLLVSLTRGLHQDGLADTLDGLAGGRTPADRLSIMRDPRIGAMGATGLFLSLILRYAGLMALPQSLRVPALVCMPALGRCAMVVLAWLIPYARAEGGLASPFLTHLSIFHVMGSTLVLTVALMIGLGVTATIVTLIGSGMVLIAIQAVCRASFGGITGDTLGATNEIVEILFLLFIPLVLVQS